MSCCGQSRSQYGVRVQGITAPYDGTVIFEYIGRTGLTAFGGVTGRKYRFEQPGAQLTVDPRDRTSLDQLPMLKQVS